MTKLNKIINWIRRIFFKKEYVIGVDIAKGNDVSCKAIWEKDLKTGELKLKSIKYK